MGSSWRTFFQIPLFCRLEVFSFIDHRLIRWVADNTSQEWRWQQLFSQIYVFTSQIRSESSQLGFRPWIARAPSFKHNSTSHNTRYIYSLLCYFTDTHEVVGSESDRHKFCGAVDWIDRAWYDSFLQIGHGANKIEENDNSQFVISRQLSFLGFVTGSPLLVPTLELRLSLFIHI